MKAVIYARYSSENQREESIDGQIRECMEYAKHNEIQVIDTYIDRALSAKTDNRPEFQRMIKESGRGGFELVIVWKLDRFSRNRYDSAHYKAILKKNGVKVISATEQISSDPSGILLESMLEGYAEYYSAELSEKVKRGMTENALKGVWNGGQVPFGYIVGKNRRLEIDSIAAPVIQEIFKLCYDGKTIKEIYYILQDKRIMRSNGKPLRYNTIRYILTNRVYIGEYNHSGIKIENAVPPIVTKELFDGVQIEIAKNAHAPARHCADEDYLLTTKLFCGNCGSMMVAQAGTSQTGTVYRYYACVKQKKHKCNKKMVPKEKLEDFIVHKTMEFLMQDEIIERLSELLFRLQHEESPLLPRLEEQLREKENEMENIVNAVQKGYAADILLERLEKLKHEKDEISVSIAKERIKYPTFSQEQFKFALQKFRSIDITDQEGKRKIIDTFINAIYVYDDSFRIIYNGSGKEESIGKDVLESSSSFSRGAPNKRNPNQKPIGEGFGFLFAFGDWACRRQ